MVVAVDWSLKKGLYVYDGESVKIVQQPEEINDDVVLIEAGAPYGLLARINGRKVLQIDGKEVKKKREKLGWAKTDENDAKVIWLLYKENPSLFREFTERSRLEAKIRFHFKQLRVIEKQIRVLDNVRRALEREFAYTVDDNDIRSRLERDREYHLNQLIRYAKAIPEFHILTQFKGISDKLAAEFIAVVGNFNRFKDFRALVGYCGIGKKRNENYNREAKNVLLKERGIVYQLAIIHKVEPYHSLYQIYKERKILAGYSKLHAHRLALRKVGYIFIRDIFKKINQKRKIWGSN